MQKQSYIAQEGILSDTEVHFCIENKVNTCTEVVEAAQSSICQHISLKCSVCLLLEHNAHICLEC